MKKKICLLSLLFLVFAGSLSAQGVSTRRSQYFGEHSFEIGLRAGLGSGLTDINTKPGMESFDFYSWLGNQSNPQLAVFLRYGINQWAAASLHLSYVRLGGERTFLLLDHSYENSITETGLRIELSVPALTDSPVNVYVHGGINLYNSDPQRYTRSGAGSPLIEVPLPDEVKGLHLGIPFGLGVSLRISSRWKLGYEFTYQHTNNHALDGYDDPVSRADSWVTHSLVSSFAINKRR